MTGRKAKPQLEGSMTERPGAAFQPQAVLVRAHRRGIPSRPGGICPTSSTAGKGRRQKRASAARSPSGGGQAKREGRMPGGISDSAPKGDVQVVDVRLLCYFKFLMADHVDNRDEYCMGTGEYMNKKTKPFGSFFAYSRSD